MINILLKIWTAIEIIIFLEWRRKQKEKEEQEECDLPTQDPLKKSDITLIDKFNRAMTADIKQEIFDDIISCEPNPSKKSTPPEDEISKRRQARKPIYVETGKTKQKTRR